MLYDFVLFVFSTKKKKVPIPPPSAIFHLCRNRKKFCLTLQHSQRAGTAEYVTMSETPTYEAV